MNANFDRRANSISDAEAAGEETAATALERLAATALERLAAAAPARMAVLRDAALLDASAVPSLDRLTRLARRVSGTPAAWITFVHQDEVYVKSASFAEQAGEVPSGPLPLASAYLLTEVVAGEHPYVIDDVRAHPLGRQCPALATRGIEAFVGMPLRDNSGLPLGVLCVGAFAPRAWGAELLEALGDVTEAVGAEVELRARTRRLSAEQQRYAELVAAVDAMVWEADIETGELLFVSPQAERLLGYPLDCWYREPGFWQKILHPEDRDAVNARSNDGIARGHDLDLEYRVMAADGRTVWLRDAMRFVRDEQNRLVRRRGMAFDVTAPKLAEAALQASRERHQFQAGLLEAVGQAVIAVDPDFNIRYWNRAAEQLYGWTAEEVIGQPVALLIPEESETLAAGIMARLATGRTWSGEFCLRRKDGSTFPGWVTDSVLCDTGGQILGFVGVASDISESKHVAERHRAFSSFGQQLNAARGPREVAEVILQVADRLIGWDCAWLDICDLDTQRSETIVLYDEIEGQRVEVPAPSSELTAGCFTLRALCEGHFKVLRSAETLARLTGEKNRPLSFGTGRPSASILVVPIRLGTRPIGALSIQSYRFDAYDDHQLELLQTLADYCAGALERAEAERDRDHLQEQLLQAQKMEAIGRLAGGVAHDFNNMLAVINGYSGLILSRLQPESDLRDAISQIAEAGRRATELTRQLLTFSRKGLLEPMPIDLATVVRGMEKMLQRLIGEDIELTTAFTPLPGEVLADPGQIEQVLMNLIINSRDAMPDGGKLSIRVGPTVPDAQFLRQHPELRAGTYAHLEVKDTGVGMTDSVRQRIFEPFFTTKETGKGTGLGLSIVFGIIRQCGGCVDVESTPGRGTTFHLYFPLTQKELAVENLEEPLSPAPGCEVVLLAEDEPMVSRLIQQVLTLQGYEVLLAHNGEEALRLAENPAVEVDLLLTDVVMPGGMNGRELAQRLRAARPEVKVLYMSGYTDDEILRAGLRQAEVAFIHKPFSPDDLLREVRRVLDA